MVAPEDEKVLRVLDLVGQQQADGLQALLAAVHIIAEVATKETDRYEHSFIHPIS